MKNKQILRVKANIAPIWYMYINYIYYICCSIFILCIQINVVSNNITFCNIFIWKISTCRIYKITLILNYISTLTMIIFIFFILSFAWKLFLDKHLLYNVIEINMFLRFVICILYIMSIVYNVNCIFKMFKLQLLCWNPYIYFTIIIRSRI